MKIPWYQVDAFTDRVFAGNPAAVCALEEWLADDVLQAIAAENNLAETAFFVPEQHRFRLRWFTPTVEVDLCGHATLASAYVLMEQLGHSENSIIFQTLSGELHVSRKENRYVLDFPARAPHRRDLTPSLSAALGIEPEETWQARDTLAVFATEQQVRALRPDLSLLKQLETFGVIVTAPGRDCDFVSRFFAPAKGVPEDPVTGSSHCTLTPYWSERLGKKALHAKQVSKRGGELWCESKGERVEIAGHAALFAVGEIHL